MRAGVPVSAAAATNAAAAAAPDRTCTSTSHLIGILLLTCATCRMLLPAPPPPATEARPWDASRPAAHRPFFVGPPAALCPSPCAHNLHPQLACVSWASRGRFCTALLHCLSAAHHLTRANPTPPSPILILLPFLCPRSQYPPGAPRSPVLSNTLPPHYEQPCPSRA